jgi:hypothetical protein
MPTSVFSGMAHDCALPDNAQPVSATDIIHPVTDRHSGEIQWERTMQVSPDLNRKIAQTVQTSMRIEGCKPVQSAEIKQQAQVLMEQHRVQVSVHRK